MRELVVVAAFDFHQLNHVICKVGKTLFIFSLGISLKDSTTTFNLKHERYEAPSGVGGIGLL
jgi:hypothetical protein